VWWCLTGPLTFLPIHAAGLYGENVAPGSKLSDFVVSSYIPSISSLITGSRVPPEPCNHVLAVALPVESELPDTGQELDLIATRVGSSNITKLLESDATVGKVIAGMENSSYIHFACHGVQEPKSPHMSGLLLAGHSRLTLSHMSQLSFPHAQLAFLSACETATGDEQLAQEAVHLAAGMLSAGYRGVIATMWSIGDSDAPHIADEVYAQLFKDSKPDPTQAARALRKAVKNFVDNYKGKKPFVEWVPYIHIGI
jgi:CHAT domain-containing protein